MPDTSNAIAPSGWKWYGHAGHFMCGRWCRFHLCTEVGPYVVSTVGQYVHPRHSKGTELTEIEWLEANPNGEEIGYQRFYETMVFRVTGHCRSYGCNCGLPSHDGSNIDFAGYNDPASATAGHMAMCEKWASQPDRTGDKEESDV